MKKNIKIVATVICISLCILLSLNIFAEDKSINGIKTKLNDLEKTMSTTYNSFSLALSAAGFVATLSGLGFAIYGFFNITRARKMVNERIKESMIDFENKMSSEFCKIQEATQKMIAGYQQKETDKAIELYLSAVKIYPKVFNAHASLGYAYLEKNNIIEALLWFNKATEIYPNDYRVYNDLARAYAKINEKHNCIINLRKMSKLNPNSGDDIKSDPIFNEIINEKEYLEIFKK